MESSPQPFDPLRWLNGDSPGWFIIEVACRAIFIYLLLQIMLRLMGRRVASQMSVSELAVVVTLGAAVGVPMQAPERGILPAIVILTIAWAFQRGLSLWTFCSRKVELFTMGDVICLVKDGRIQLDEMKRCVMSRERLFAVLRGMSIETLGEVRRVYVEATGSFSVYRMKSAKPGLAILPLFDQEMRDPERHSPHDWACMSCGTVLHRENKPEDQCPNCPHAEWTEALTKSFPDQ